MTDPSHPNAEGDAEREAAERDRRRRVLYVTLILFIGFPIYMIVASYIVGGLTAPVENADGTMAEKPVHWAIEFVIYAVLGIVWALPLKRLVTGVAKAPPTV